MFSGQGCNGQPAKNLAGPFRAPFPLSRASPPCPGLRRKSGGQVIACRGVYFCPGIRIVRPNVAVHACLSATLDLRSFEEHKTFEVALAQHYSSHDRWDRIAACLPNKTSEEVQAYFQMLEEDVVRIQTGLVPLPNYEHSLVRSYSGRTAGTQRREAPSGKAGPSPKKSKVDTSGKEPTEGGSKRKGVPWTEEEHKLFLLGLAKFGKGDWRSIARNFVQSRTPTQVASHAQKYFIRLNSTNKKDKRRASIHDITAEHILPEMFEGPTARVAQRVC